MKMGDLVEWGVRWVKEVKEVEGGARGLTPLSLVLVKYYLIISCHHSYTGSARDRTRYVHA
jgi:hypothetical protein